MSDSLRRRKPVLWLCVTGLLTGMCVILSMSVLSIPVPGGHLYFCDTVIYIAAFLLDPFAAFVVGGIGSFLGDMMFYPAPMFVSLVTHGLQAVAASVIYHKLSAKKYKLICAAAGVIVGGVIMVAGYTFGRAFVYSTKEYAILKLPFEVLQALFGGVVSLVLCFPCGLEKQFQRIVK